MLNDITIIVATHKKSPMPDGEMYLPLHVGAATKYNEDGSVVDFGYTRDDTGENISTRNPNFGTQTGLYWVWKNLDSDYKGLVHYRRYFAGKKADKKNMIGSVISYDEIKPMLETYKVFVPKKRWYVIETIYSHYSHTLDKSHLDICREIIKEKSPSYIEAYDKVLNRRWGYMFNMMILKKELMDDYCSWLFDILFEIYERVDKTGMTAFECRFCGRVSEILFDVWLENKIETGMVSRSQIKELPYMEDVNWGFKIKTFLMAKFFHKKYGVSS